MPKDINETQTPTKMLPQTSEEIVGDESDQDNGHSLTTSRSLTIGVVRGNPPYRTHDTARA